jgi:hypothetical protein
VEVEAEEEEKEDGGEGRLGGEEDEEQEDEGDEDNADDADVEDDEDDEDEEQEKAQLEGLEEVEELERLSMQLDQEEAENEEEQAHPQAGQTEPRAEQPLSEEYVFKAGWVWKANRTNNGWRKRWLVLDGDSLTYYSQPPSGPKKGATTTPSRRESHSPARAAGNPKTPLLKAPLLSFEHSQTKRKRTKRRHLSFGGQSVCVECERSSPSSQSTADAKHQQQKLFGSSRSTRVQGGRTRVPRGSYVRLTGLTGLTGLSGGANGEELCFSGFSESESQEWARAIESNRRAASSQWGEEACQAMAQIMLGARFGRT